MSIRVILRSLLLSLVCMFCLVFANKCEIMTNVSMNYTSVISGHCKQLENNDLDKVQMGYQFFRHLIYDREGFRMINEKNMCYLMHFFFQQAMQNGQSVRFSTGMFILYDSTGNFYNQLMAAKSAQNHSNEHRSGYIRRLCYFCLDAIKYLFRIFSRNESDEKPPLIYLRGDESSHFHERGTKDERYRIYPAYGIDIPHGCMPNNFGHILFGKLKSLSTSVDYDYGGDRIYIKPEAYGIQQPMHYIAHARHYLESLFQAILCRFSDRLHEIYCRKAGLFHEWIDWRMLRNWNKIIDTTHNLTTNERHKMRIQASSFGIHEIYRQSLRYPSMTNVNNFRGLLEQNYGYDVVARKGNEIIFTTKELLNISLHCKQPNTFQ